MRQTPSTRTARFVSRLVIALAIGVGATVVTGGVLVATADAGSAPAPTSDGSQHGGSTASLSQGQPEICDRSAGPFVAAFNENIERVPQFLRAAVGGTVIHGIIDNDTTGNYTFVTGSDATVQSYRTGEPESPDIRILTDCETFTNISEAEEPTSAFWSEYRNNEIVFVGVGLVNRAIVEALTHLPTLVALVVLVLAFVGYRRVSMLSRSREGEPGLQRTDAGTDEPQSGGSDGDGGGGGS